MPERWATELEEIGVAGQKEIVATFSKVIASAPWAHLVTKFGMEVLGLDDTLLSAVTKPQTQEILRAIQAESSLYGLTLNLTTTFLSSILLPFFILAPPY